MEHKKLLIAYNKAIGSDVYEMKLMVDDTSTIKCGQFIQIKIANCTLRRPISISAINDDSIVIVYRIVGKGTKQLSMCLNNTLLDVLMPLGNGFKIHRDVKNIGIFGGGIGIAPLFEVAKQYQLLNCKVDVYLGFLNKDNTFLIDAFEKLGCNVIVSSDDGSIGIHGNVIDAYKSTNIDYDYVYACGPKGMLNAIQHSFSRGYISLESYMACGFGVCNGCVCKDAHDDNKHYYTCTDGPVFKIGEVML